MGVVSVAAAIGCLTGAVTLLSAHDARTERLLSRKAAEIRAEMDRMEDDYRRIMRDMGHNVMILHADQSIPALHAEGQPDTWMPEEYATKLARGGITTLNHLLPVLQGKILWPERGLKVILHGTPGQIPIPHRQRFLTPDGSAYLEPIVEAVPDGTLNIGSGIARELGLNAGDSVEFRGETFRIHRVLAMEGGPDDLAVWCSLDKAQDWLGRPGRINVIFALECICHADELGKITAEVNRILPETQVLEFSSRVVARAAARQRAAETSRRALEDERIHRQRLGRERRNFASFLVPVLLVASGAWVFFLILGNVRERRAEIGILRAMGVRSSRIVGIFMMKAALIGLLGALAGYPAGVIIGARLEDMGVVPGIFGGFFSPWLFLVSVVIAAALCLTAGLIPSVIAADYDPAETLREG